MKEYRYGNAIIRIHGEYDLENVKEATAVFLKKAEAQRKRRLKSNTEENPQKSKVS